ncbi:manganese-dependent ADP-ribose/CDP-alcohol diphosphatase [Pundamilia nyererei]|uniref:Manganese-dependent ADP-ribose/CDP-alcohol diphosphatase n=3 Tax=Haplochromini TaxID=319058 RepID=A0A3B4FMI4_9CICH|nr:PREDICTED: manganese-dependent ADP-ribose/CDP-alcohol diphosphatase [Pundamilia nyererei]XP_005923826.1 manganese-dependent ADP-ribose/CDP-alcohol diphosphatase [Haplochromis burtoni]XP_026033444.1 manganese-dependent ADP-ribose/CDP-alcohol diphosphatase [Astatotilapia calliptera]
MDDCRQQTLLFTFGVIADIQYADIDDGYNYTRTRRRYYRSGLQLLRNARKSWSESAVKPAFILQLGDIIDGFNKPKDASERALDTVLRELSSCPAEVYHVWGNHEFYNFSRSALLRSKLNSTLHTDRSMSTAPAGSGIYAYSFSPFPGFTFVVLDAYDVSLLGREKASEQYVDAMNLIKQYNKNEDLNCPPAFNNLTQRFTMFNGGFSKDQLDWLDSLLSSADEKQEKVTIVSHLPIHPDCTDTICLAWNFEELLAVIRSHTSVVCYMAGHAHDGGYCQDEDTGVHHLTVDGVIETPPDSNAFATVSVYGDRMELKGYGSITDRVFLFPSRQKDTYCN